jgi:outer membrane protein OmpA-like peptidoglycan-associated protein
LFFKADSTEFLSDSLAAKTLDQTSKFYASTSSKNYTFDIQGTAHEGASTSSGVKIANDRASKIKDELTKRGVPAERVNIIEPKSSDNSNDSSGSSDRSITIFIKLPADCK